MYPNNTQLHLILSLSKMLRNAISDYNFYNCYLTQTTLSISITLDKSIGSLNIDLLNLFLVVHLSLIIITFYTGHYDHSQNIVLMRKKDVVMTYLLSYLFVDILAFVPEILRLDIIRAHINEEHYIYMYVGPLLIVNRYVR